VLDDNHTQYPNEEFPVRKDEYSIPLKDRIIEKTQGCWNCKSYSRGEMVVKHLRECRQRDEAAKIAELGYLPTLSKLGDMEMPGTAGDARYLAWEKAAKLGEIGMCMAGAIPDDFVHHKFFCSSWTGAEGASVAREGAKPDLLPAEVAEMVEQRAKKPIGG
jgi:hypothetical protein